MDACVYLLPVSNHPVVSTPTLASLQTDPAGHNDDKSAQIFMSIEFHFGSAHGSFSAFCFTDPSAAVTTLAAKPS